MSAAKLLKQAQRLGAAGFRVFPLHEKDGKVCRVNGWPEKASTESDAIARLWQNRDVVAIAIATGTDWTVVDLDVPGDRHQHDGAASLQAAGVELPATLTVRTGSGGAHAFYRTAGAPRRNVSNVEHPEHGKLLGVDVRGAGGFVKVHDARALLDGIDTIVDAPGWLPLADEGGSAGTSRRATSSDLEAWLGAERKAKPTKLTREAVEAVPLEGGTNSDLPRILRPILMATVGRRGRAWAYETARERWTRNWPGQDFAKAFDLDFARLAGEWNERTLTHTFPLAAKVAPAAASPKETPMTDRDVRHDADRAEMIAAELHGDLLYVDGQSPHIWDGRRWVPRGDAYAIEMVRRWHEDAARSAIGSDLRGDEIGRLLSRSAIAASEALLRGILAVRADQMDADPDLLNVQNGVVDLRTGVLSPHDPALRMTKVAGAEYRPGAKHADWTNALGALPSGVARWLQVRFGQGITGHLVPDDKLVLLRGGGENGKSVILGGVMAASGGYAAALPHKLLLGSASDHTTELTTLQGLRLGFLEELPEGRRLDVVRLKTVFGTEQVTARRIRRDNETFDATHSIFVTSNYRPEVPEVDHGTWRRLLLVEFPYTFSTKPDLSLGQLQADPGLRARMKHAKGARAAAVLAWLVEGAVRWYAADRQFPAPPVEVAEATREWRASSDVVNSFADDALRFEPDGFTSTRELYQRFVTFLAARGRHEWSETLFAGRFESHDVARGLRKERRRVDGKQVSGWWGVTLLPTHTVLEGWKDAS